MKECLVIAHRGASAYVKGNTSKSIIIARKFGADGVELDIRTTLDKKLICFHDSYIYQKGSKKFISEMDINSLKDFDNEILEVEDALELSRDFKIIILDIKDVNISHELLNIVKKLNLTDKVLFVTGYLNILNELKDLEINKGFWFSNKIDISYIAKKYNLSVIKPNYKIFNEEVITLANSLNLKVFVWTVNDERLALKLREQGVNAIITDVPDRIKHAFETL
ncbi:MAG: glycerophosphodiester phosphodiesterase [Candidatus Parvarchaeota archaeon]|nr:glycerophosphodiester phosphodiesterase [Candidatus Rehaiarchaeum fermentans]